jgi:hypothetical protein
MEWVRSFLPWIKCTRVCDTAGAPNLEPGTLNLEPRTLNLELDARDNIT